MWTQFMRMKGLWAEKRLLFFLTYFLTINLLTSAPATKTTILRKGLNISERASLSWVGYLLCRDLTWFSKTRAKANYIPCLDWPFKFHAVN